MYAPASTVSDSIREQYIKAYMAGCTNFAEAKARLGLADWRTMPQPPAYGERRCAYCGRKPEGATCRGCGAPV